MYTTVMLAVAQYQTQGETKWHTEKNHTQRKLKNQRRQKNLKANTK